MGIRRAVPAPLALLLCVVAAFGIAWALITPAWQSPDEDVHFSYSQTLGELHRLPGGKGRAISGEQQNAADATNLDPTVFFTYSQPESSRAGYERWKRSRARPDDGGGSNAASGYPPAYYLYEAVPYVLASSGDIFDRLYTMRIFSVAWLLVTTTAAWLLAGEVFGRSPRRQLLAAAAVGLWPMLAFMSASVNPDAMLYATWGLALWLGARTINRGLTVANGLGLGGAIGLAMVTKASSIALIPAGALAVAIALTRTPREERRRLLRGALAAAAAFLVPVAAWYVTVRVNDRSAYAQTGVVTQAGGGGAGGPSLRGFLSYVWQYYLPRLPGQQVHKFSIPVISHYPAYNVWVGTSWGAFGWVLVYFASWAYKLFAAVTVLIAAAAAFTGVRALRAGGGLRASLRRAWPLGLFFAAAFFPLWFGVHWSEYKLGSVFIQGRYLFPLAGLAGLVVAQATMALPARFRGVATGVLIGGLVVFQIAALLLVTQRYYA